MFKNTKEIVLSLFLSVISVIFTQYFLEIDFYFLSFPAISGLLIALIFDERKSIAKFKKVFIASIFYGISFWFLMILKSLVSDVHGWQSREIVISVFIFIIITFLSALIGIAIKSFYKLFKKKIDKYFIYFVPLFLSVFSLFFSQLKFGDSQMSRVYGWPKHLLIFHIKDLVEGFIIKEWSLAPGYYFLLNYAFYFIIVIIIYFFIRFLNKIFTKKINSTSFLFLFMILISAVFFISPEIKQYNIQKSIVKANFCEINSDCVNLGSKCPFGCAIFVNKSYSKKIESLLYNFDSTCEYGCLQCSRALCLNNKCQPVCGEENQGNDYEVTEILEHSCSVDTDCQLPFDYAIRSSCPYETKCLEEKCTVICPEF